MTPKNWPVSSYTNETWTDVVAETAVVAAVVLTNTHATNDVTVELQLADSGGATLFTLLNPTDLAALASPQVLDLRSLSLYNGQKLQVRAAGAGIHVLASGAA